RYSSRLRTEARPGEPTPVLPRGPGGGGEIDAGRALAPPSSRHRREGRARAADDACLLLRFEQHDTPAGVRIAERREDLAADAEVRVAPMRAFDRACERERKATKLTGSHLGVVI